MHAAVWRAFDLTLEHMVVYLEHLFGLFASGAKKEFDMNIGMLWFDSNHALTVSKRVEQAASYYEAKYGRVATLCFVHPSTLTEATKVGRTEIQPMDTVQPNHFWLGIKLSGQSLRSPQDKPAISGSRSSDRSAWPRLTETSKSSSRL